jgi:tryptophanyl-tRNA synthetase
MKRALTGIRPSGDLHLGNLLGTIKPGLALGETHECFYFVADLHALTTMRNPNDLKKFSYDVAAAWISLGLDPKKHTLWRQSDCPEVTELSWYLSCVTGYGFLEKAHAFKDAQSKNKEVNHGVFAYPVLMAADILLYDPDVVPVGKDQKQHVEMARDMASSWNALFGETLKLPDVLIREEVMTIPGLDGQKMSKSYNNVIPVFAKEADLKKAVMSIVTDSTPFEAPKTMKGTLLGTFFEVCASKDIRDDIESKLNAGNFGWGHAKLALFEVLNEMLSPARKEYESLRSDEKKLETILLEGRDKAKGVALKVLSRVREAAGFRAC